MRHQISQSILAMLCCLAMPAVAVAEGNISQKDKYAWSETSGWSNFVPTAGGVAVYPDHLEGFAWAENIGWIKLGSYAGGGAFTYANKSNTDWGVNLNKEVLSGYAWSETAGWINFSTVGGVTLNLDKGDFDGYAWAENLGWLHLKGSVPSYSVRINTQTLTVALAGSGSGTVHSIPAGISCASSGVGCSGTFFQNWPVALGATPEWKSLFVGYSGDSALNTFPMDFDKKITATFDLNYKVRLLPDANYASIQDAYDNAADGDEIRAQTHFFQEVGGLTLGEITPKTIRLKGGYQADNTSYNTVAGMTSIQGPMVIRKGKVSVERLTVK